MIPDPQFAIAMRDKGQALRRRRCRVAGQCTASGVVRHGACGGSSAGRAAQALLGSAASSDRADDYSPGSLTAIARSLRPFASSKRTS
jgi:hypothetical protein